MKATTADNLRAAADTVRDALAAFNAQAEAVGKTDAAIAACKSEIKELRAAALDDVAAAQRLAGAQVRLGLLQNQKAALEEELPALADAVRAALRLVPDSLGAFLSPVRERLLEEVGSALTPFEPDAGRRRQMAQETTAARKLHVVASCPWHIFAVQESPVGTARTVLKDVAAILDGATPWKSA